MEKISNGIQIAWELAAKEASYSGFAEIEPGHFFLSILKLADLADKIGTEYPSLNPEIVSEVTKETEPVRQVFIDMKYDITAVRRSFRELIRKDNIAEDIGVLHRSDESRNLFEQLFSGKYRNNPPQILHFILQVCTFMIKTIMGNRF